MNKQTTLTIIFLLVLIALLLAACTPYKENEQKLKYWVKNHPKPITITGSYINQVSHYKKYTLIDSDGEIYQSGEVRFMLPDTLKK